MNIDCSIISLCRNVGQMPQMPERQYLNCPKHVVFSLDVGTKTAGVVFSLSSESRSFLSKRLLPLLDKVLAKGLCRCCFRVQFCLKHYAKQTKPELYVSSQLLIGLIFKITLWMAIGEAHKYVCLHLRWLQQHENGWLEGYKQHTSSPMDDRCVNCRIIWRAS